MRAETYPLQVLLLTVSGRVNRHQADVIAYLVEENRVLREQLKGRRLRLNDDQRRRLAAKAKILGRRVLNSVTTIVTPDTLMRWHKRLIAAQWTHLSKRFRRPGLTKEIKTLAVRMASDHSSWSYCRIQGELKGLSHCVASTTIANGLKENGIKSAPDRPLSWRSLLQWHWGQVAATDFFAVEAWTPKGLKTHFVLFVIALNTREVHLAGMTTAPNEAFMAQVARILTDAVDGFLSGHHFLICDHDSKTTARFERILKDAGVAVVLTPRQAPDCNAYAERFVLSIKSESLDLMIFFGELSLGGAVASYIEHDHGERAHQGIGNERIAPSVDSTDGDGECSERLGGLLKHYRRAA